MNLLPRQSDLQGDDARGVEVQCPFCGAKRGKPCEDIGTRRPLGGVHRDRWQRAVHVAFPDRVR